MSNRRRHEGNREDPTPSKCIGVFGLSLYTSERELEQEFKKFGPLEKVQVVLDGHSGRSRGFAFIYYENVEDAAEARNAMSGADLDGRKIRVDFSITKYVSLLVVVSFIDEYFQASSHPHPWYVHGQAYVW